MFLKIYAIYFYRLLEKFKYTGYFYNVHFISRILMYSGHLVLNKFLACCKIRTRCGLSN